MPHLCARRVAAVLSDLLGGEIDPDDSNHIIHQEAMGKLNEAFTHGDEEEDTNNDDMASGGWCQVRGVPEMKTKERLQHVGCRARTLHTLTSTRQSSVAVRRRCFVTHGLTHRLA